MNYQPRARYDGVITEHVEDQLVAYDPSAQMAHSLSADATVVWEHCDGNRSIEQIAAASSLDVDSVSRAVSELGERGLLEEDATPKISRREIGKRMAATGGAAFAAPMVYSVVVAPAMAAASAQTCFSTNPGGVPTGAQPAAGSKGYSTSSACNGGTSGQFNFTCYVTHSGTVVCANSSCQVYNQGCGTCCAGTCTANVCTQ